MTFKKIVLISISNLLTEYSTIRLLCIITVRFSGDKTVLSYSCQQQSNVKGTIPVIQSGTTSLKWIAKCLHSFTLTFPSPCICVGILLVHFPIYMNLGC